MNDVTFFIETMKKVKNAIPLILAQNRLGGGNPY